MSNSEKGRRGMSWKVPKGRAKGGLGCLGESSERIRRSKPRSLNLSAIEIPIKAIKKDSKEEEEEWEANIKENQSITIEEINFDNLLRFWFIPI